MPKKSQLQSETLVYALTIVIVGVVLVLGYRFITTSSSRGEQVSQIQLKNSIQNSVSTLSSDYGSVKVKTFNVPTKYDELCFTSTTNRDELPKAFVEKNPIAADAVETGKNAFLLGKDFDSFTVGDLKLPNKVTCITAVNGKISLKIEGKGDSSLVSAVESVASVVNVPEGLVKEDIAIASSDYAAELQIPAGTNIDYPSGAEEKVVVNKVSAPSTGSLVIAGDVYDFKPDGTKFNQPIPITLPYDPDKVSEPNELKIYYYDGSNWVQLPSSFDVDENRNTVTGYTSHFTLFGVGSEKRFMSANVECYGGKEFVLATSCKTTKILYEESKDICKGHCDTGGKCGVNTFEAVEECIECADSDSGKEFNFKGKTTEIGSQYEKNTLTDICYNLSSTLIEYYCNGNFIDKVFYECPFGCFDGRCLFQNQTGIIREVKCFDSDDKDFYSRGIVFWENYTYEDYCSYDDTLVEFTCNSGGVNDIKIGCTCEKGECIELPPIPPKRWISEDNDTSGSATDCNVNVPYGGNENRYAVWNRECEDYLQAPNSGGIGQGCCELACGASELCDEQSPTSECSDCIGTPPLEDLSGPGTDCNGNVSYKENPERYAIWNGLCDDFLQAPNSGGIGQGCCEYECGASDECDERFPIGECAKCGTVEILSKK